MNKRIFMRGLLWLTLLLAAGFAACSDDDTEGTVTLHYPEISDIGPSMPGVVPAPTYQGAKPSEFTIEGITLDEAAFTDDGGSFSIDPTSGAVNIAADETLPTGEYSLSISCFAGGVRNYFADILKVHMLAAAPENITVTPEVLEIPYAEAKTSKLSAQVAAVDESVTISNYRLLQEEGKEYFTVSDKGVISVNPKFEGDILPGVYTPALKLSSLAGSGLYENCVTIKITSKPLEVTYKPTTGRSEVNHAFASPVPALKGSTEDGVQWVLKSVVPETEAFSIDAATGVISLAEENGLAVDDEYTLSLTVTNKYGSADFDDVYKVLIVAFIEPIDAATFSYDDTEVVEACAFSVNKKAGFVGGEVTFSLGETLPEGVDGKIVIDEQTGEITAVKGNSIPCGTYEIPVVATNTKGSAETKAKITVTPNPNMFTKFGYGNNLNLDPETNADQFLYEQIDTGKNHEEILTLAYNDFPEGKTPVFKVENLHNWLQNGTSVAADGTVTVKVRHDRAGQVGYFRVTATVGTGATAVSRSTIVFITVSPKDARVVYKPFVHRVNPRTGGLSGIPLTFTGSVDRANLVIGCRSNKFFLDLRNDKTAQRMDPSTTGWTKEQIDAWHATYAYRIWGVSWVLAGKLNNAGSWEPFTYYDTTNISLTNKLGYIDPTADYQIRINPNVWMLDGAYTNGIFTFNAAYSDSAKAMEDVTSSKWKTYIGGCVWLDENF